MSRHEKLADEVLQAARQRYILLASAESCTGGLITAALTDIAGSSDVVDRGFVAYSNVAKSELLGIPKAIIATHGAVSCEVAAAMAEGALKKSKASVTISTTGIAGPGGGRKDKPVGLVWFGLAQKNKTTLTRHVHFGDIGRENVRSKSVETALAFLLENLVC